MIRKYMSPMADAFCDKTMPQALLNDASPNFTEDMPSASLLDMVPQTAPLPDEKPAMTPDAPPSALSTESEPEAEGAPNQEAADAAPLSSGGLEPGRKLKRK